MRDAEPAISVESLIEPYPQFEKEFRRQIEFHRTVGAELVHDLVSGDAQGGPALGYESMTCRDTRFSMS